MKDRDQPNASQSHSYDQATREAEAGSKPEEKRAPSISLPKGGGAIKGIGEKFGANPVTGTGTMNIPLTTSPGRSGFGPQLSLTYDSGSGNGPFGFGWSLSLPSITRKTDKGLPRYLDADESDVFILSGSEDLVPALIDTPGGWTAEPVPPRNLGGEVFEIRRYRPRVEGLFSRIERWTSTQTGETHWRSIGCDNVTTLYGTDDNSRIYAPADSQTGEPKRIFSWLICQSYDDKGNAVVYEYAAEDGRNVDRSEVNERNRVRGANRYLKSIKYGNRTSRLVEPNPDLADWMFEVVFDYEEGRYAELPSDPARPAAEQHRLVRAAHASAADWARRPDPFSIYRSGFEVRTYRRCRRVLMFHRFPELGAEPCLVRATEFDYADLDYAPPATVEQELAHQGSTRFASFIRAVTESGFVRDASRPVSVVGGISFVTYVRQSLPPVEFEYSKADIRDEVQALDAESLENLPIGLDGTAYQWVDLDGEGLAGILTEQAGGWFYKRNLGDGKLGPLAVVPTRPSLANLRGGRQQLLDLSGDGRLELVSFAGATPGFYKRTEDEHWENFQTFERLPNLRWDDPNLRFIDLNGDGHADILITEDEVFTWYPSLAEEGFAPAARLRMPLDEERGPRLVFADGTQSIYLADMCGDGLTDLARIRNGEVCYWPNLGHGRFGARVTMDDAPRFDANDQFEQRRVRVADLDGSGTSDIIYLGRDGVRLYFNQSGNRWSEPRLLRQFPQVDNLSAVTTADLLGNGTACLVWSSPLSADARRPIRYIDLMGRKPHLLVGWVNNLGAETRVEYAPSTKFYLADRAAGRPWITKIPFPVHVVERVENYDRIGGNRFVTRHAYHHGYFDGTEREFRGFGMVEQWDTEEFAALNENQQFPSGTNVDESSHVPPVLTRTWYHTGVYLSRERVSDFFAGLRDERDAGEYYREPGLTNAQARQLLLDDTVLPAGWTIEEEREACRALKGAMLRQEVYALDGTTKEQHPYTVTEQNFSVERLQPGAGNRHAVIFTHPRETLTYNYERDPTDPRVGHALTLEVDGFGNVLKEASIAYGRRVNVTVVNEEGDAELRPNPGLAELDSLDRQRQTTTLITYTEYKFTNPVREIDDYRAPLSSEGCTYELTGLALPAGQNRFTFTQVLNAGAAAAPISYEVPATPGLQQKRVIECVRTLYRRNDLTGPLLPEQLESRALPFETYKLALTAGLVTNVYAGRVTDAMLADEARYVHLGGDADWWAPSGREFYSPDSSHTAAQELAEARAHFFLPRRYRDPFHTNASPTETIVTYDANDLLLVETRDPLGNHMTVGERDAAGNIIADGNNYRVLLPRLLMDANRNRSAVAFDALGLVAGTALAGKPEDVPQRGDSLDGFRADLTPAELEQFFLDPKGPVATSLLGGASSRIIYDLSAYLREPDPQQKPPVFAATLARETHLSEPVPPAGLKIQTSFSYSDGFGREIQKKIPAEAGPVPQRGPDGRVIPGANGQPLLTPNDVAPRWVGSGWRIFDNKGEPVREYEPYFTGTHRFEFDVRIGLSPVVFRDPAGRVVATLHPNHTWDKVTFDPWRQTTWDTSDTVSVIDPKLDADVGDFFRRLPDAAYLPTWLAQRAGGALGPQEQMAAQKAAIHADTPAVAHFDSMGRTFLTVAHNRFKRSDSPPAAPPEEEFYRSRILLDIEGNEREVRDAVIQNGDAQGRVVMRYDYDLLSGRLRQTSMEAGERRMLNDAAGKLLYAWDGRAHRLRTAYDQMRRPIDTFLAEGVGPELLVGRTVYGETLPDPEDENLRGQVVRLFDQAGVVTTDRYDFKGNQLRSARQLAVAYSSTLDWSAAVPLAAETFVSATSYDALNRPTALTAPDASVVRPVYNEGNLLERIEANLRGEAAVTTFVNDIDYDAKGRRSLVEYGNGARTAYEYDPLTLRLARLLTVRDAATFPEDCPQPPPAGFPGCQVQDLRYTYDTMGNVVLVRDGAQQRVFFRNRRVEPDAEYTYDSLNRLIEATGREHLGQAAAPSPTSYNDRPRVGILLSAGDGNALGRYVQRYVYDAVGNFTEVRHRGSDPVNPGWTRVYSYAEASQLEPTKRSNRLTATAIGAPTETYSVGGDGYDAHGNMQRLPQLQAVEWDYADQLRMTRRQAVNADDEDGLQHQGERTWYVYNSEGQRVRKVTESAPGNIREERIYLGGFEVYRRAGANPLTRETLHVADDKQRIAFVETRTQGVEPGLPARLIRYQLANHLGSASLELDGEAQLVSYEEYYPYGSTSYRSVRNQNEAPNRYRYTGKERDDESGLYYHGARYYIPWLSRWMSCDPVALKDGVNLYLYVRCNPLKLTDPSGTLSWWEEKLDAIVNPQNSVAKAVMDNLDKRGEALVNAPAAMAEVYKKEGAVGVGASVAKGLVHLVEDTAQAGVDVGSAVYNRDEGWKEKAASRGLDLVLGVADIVTIVDGAGAAKNAGTGAMAVAKDVAAAAKNGTRAMVTAEGVVVSAGRGLAMTGQPAAALGQGAKATAITMMQMKNMTGGPAAPAPPPPGGGKPLPPVRRIPEGVGKEPARIKPPTVTARPKGGAPTARDAAALADRGVTPRAAFPRSPLHHLIPQELLKNPAIKRLLKKRKIDIDDFTVSISEGEHTAVHYNNLYNQQWKDFFTKNPNATRKQILDFKNQMKTDFGMGGLPEVRYPR